MVELWFVCVINRRVMFIGRGEVFGQWNCNWDYTWQQLKETPLLTPKGIQILLKVRQALTVVGQLGGFCCSLGANTLVGRQLCRAPTASVGGE